MLISFYIEKIRGYHIRKSLLAIFTLECYTNKRRKGSLSVMTLVIMAAGMGSRYGGLKQIDPVGQNGEFILDYSIYDAKLAGFDKVVFIIKEENLTLFQETVGDRVAKNIQVEYVFQRIEDIPRGMVLPQDRAKPWGTAQAVLCCKDIVKENFAVINADDFYGREAFFLLAEFLKQPQTGTSHFCMVGYVLENTLTENGHVARGVCSVNKEGYLTNVTERTKIERIEDIVYYFEGNDKFEIDVKSIVSMNCWGFTTEIFKAIENNFLCFLKDNQENILKAEYFLPFVVDDLLKVNQCDVKVLKSKAKWYGVTYHEDKEKVMNYIASQMEQGVYPKKLWN